MKAVMLSIRPEWCEKIAQGQKTVELRKTRPKLQTPFKCYIYCTKDKYGHLYRNNTGNFEDEFPLLYTKHNAASLVPKGYINGMVIGEFVCDDCSLLSKEHYGYIEKHGRLSPQQLKKYMGIPEGQELEYWDNCYGWHISKLAIYDTPRPLYELFVKCNENCEDCDWWESVKVNADEFDMDCTSPLYGYKPLKRPPQSWCYVEDLDG